MKIKNIYKLVTKEDGHNIHKSLGIMCLINFIYRFYNVFLYNDMKFTDTHITPGTLLLHGALSTSSLIFKIPEIRITKKPIIFQEFRSHSILFGLRSIVCCLLFYYKLSIYYNILVINLTLLLSDVISRNSKTTTMRKMPFHDTIEEVDRKNISLMHSKFQFSATLYMLININSAFSPLLSIQLAAFLMTLVKKSIISENEWHKYYAISLWINLYIYNVFDHQYQVLYVAFFSSVLSKIRFNYKVNKYILWNIAGLVYLYLQRFENVEFVEKKLFNNIMNIILSIFLLEQIYLSRKVLYN